jgi:5-methylcytosine-specific restriction endonuclease McrA
MKANQNLGNDMHTWFVYLFNQRKNNQGFVKCFECGKSLHEYFYKNLSIVYSHILNKKKYPKYAGDPENVEIVCPDCHNLYELKPKSAEKQYAKKQELIKLYNL